MTGAKSCVCRGQPLNLLVAAWVKRAKRAVADGTTQGRPMQFKDLQLAAVLVRKLSEDTPMPFDARYRTLDHHLSACPCSPRFRAAAGVESSP